MSTIGMMTNRPQRRISLFYKMLIAFVALSIFPAMFTGMRLLTLNNELLAAGETEWQLPKGAVEEVTGKLRLELISYLTYTFMGIGILTFFASGEVIGPINKLRQYIERYRMQPTTEKIVINSGDEVEDLAISFNQMTDNLHNLQESLEKLVNERTEALERQTRQLQATALVGRAAASIRDLDELLTRATELISDQFNFYHAGIFLLDANNQNAVLRAANSPGGKKMLESGHKLRVSETSIVGYVASMREPRIALNVGTDAVHFKNPYLPETRSEMALPLIAGNRLWGVLDVQSEEEEAFVQEDVTNLQVLADQVAIAIENAQLFVENQTALAELQSALETSRKAFGELSREAWTKLLRSRSDLGYKCRKLDTMTPLVSAATAAAKASERPSSGDAPGKQGTSRGDAGSASEDILLPISGEWDGDMLEASRSGQPVSGKDNSLAIPIKIRDHIAGVVKLRKGQSAEKWSEQEISLVGTLSDQLSVALESARLYEDTRRRAERERLTGEIISKVRASNDPQVIMKTAVRELRKALQASRVQALVTEAPTEKSEHPE